MHAKNWRYISLRSSWADIAFELTAGVIVLVGLNLLLYGYGGAVTMWACFILGGVLILHSLCKILAKAVRRIGGGTAFMTIMAIVCLGAVMATPALGDSTQPEDQGYNGRGYYFIYPVQAFAGETEKTVQGLPPSGCRTIVGFNIGTEPELTVSVNPLHIYFSGVDYMWPVSVTYCWNAGYHMAGGVAIIDRQWFDSTSVRVNTRMPWQRVDGHVVRDYSYVNKRAVFNSDHSCVTVRFHAQVRVLIPPVPHFILPALFITKPWIQFNSLCVGGGHGAVTFDDEAA